MNAIVKTFLVINLLLSAFYCAFQIALFSSRQEWKEQYKDLSDDFTTAQGQWDSRKLELENEVRTKDVSIDTLTSKNTDLDASVLELKAKLESEVSELKSARQELDQKRTRVELLENNLAKETEELSETRQNLADARQAAETARANLIDLRELVVIYEKEKGKLRGDLEISRSKMLKLEDDLKNSERIFSRLEAKGIKIDEVLAGANGPDVPINAKVLAVRPEVNVVLLSVGREDLVREGYKFTVYNGGTYKGKVQVESVYPNMCSARILSDLQAEAQVILEGDSASTRVY